MNELQNLVPTFEVCKALQKKYPAQQASLNWFAYNVGRVGGDGFTAGTTIYYEVGKKDQWNIGVNHWAIRFVQEIVPAYTLQDIIELYDGPEKIKNVQQLAELLIK